MSSISPMVGLWWLSAVDPTAGLGVPAPLNQLLIRTDDSSLYFKSGQADTAWTKVGSGAVVVSTNQAWQYTANGAEANPLVMGLPVARASANYVVMVEMGGPAGTLITAQAIVSTFTVNQFQVEFSAPLVAGQVVQFFVADLT